MHVVTPSCVLYLWMCALTIVKSKDCRLVDFLNGPRYDLNFDTSNLADAYPSGERVRVGCNTGYTGFFTITCGQNGWKAHGNNCQPRLCGHPGDSPFAEFDLVEGDDYVFGAVIQYKCQPGYQMISRTDRRVCMARGWDGIVPTCRSIHCPPILVENNVEVIGNPDDATYGNVIRFRCRESDMILQGPVEIYCDEIGNWSQEPPTCKGIICAKPEIENGWIRSHIAEYRENQILEYKCNPSYVPVNARVSRCMKVGQSAEWSPLPECQPVICTLTVPPVEGTKYKIPTKSVFHPGETLQVTCEQPDYWIYNQQTSHITTRCQGNGNWDISPVCKEKSCGYPAERGVTYPWNEDYVGQTRGLGRIVNYRCAYGYTATDPRNKATCTGNGWIPSPLCEAMTCHKLEIRNAVITSKDTEIYHHNDKVTFECIKDHEGTFTTTCIEGVWYRQGECHERRCDNPPSYHLLSDASRRDTFWGQALGSKRRYTCKPGYKNVEGKEEATCTIDGWMPNPLCEEICSIPQVENGFSFRYQGIFHYSCNTNFKPFAGSWWGTAQCNNDKLLGVMRCIDENKCGKIPEIPHAKLEIPDNDDYQEGQPIRFTCDQGYNSVISHITCLNGEWDTGNLLSSTICSTVEGACNTPPKVENAVITTMYQKYYMSDTEVTYQCRNGNNDTLTCRNGEWETKNIQCIINASKDEEPPTKNTVSQTGGEADGGWPKIPVGSLRETEV